MKKKSFLNNELFGNGINKETLILSQIKSDVKDLLNDVDIGGVKSAVAWVEITMNTESSGVSIKTRLMQSSRG